MTLPPVRPGCEASVVCDLTLWSLFAGAFASAALLRAARGPCGFWRRGNGPAIRGCLSPSPHSATRSVRLRPGLLGGLLARRQPLDRPRKPAQQHAVTWLRHRGSPLLPLSWLPRVGDPLCVGAGGLRMPLALAGTFIAAARAARSAVVAAAA